MATKQSKDDVDHNLGTLIDGCVLDRKLGQGGMGIAYLATHGELQRQFVIKILNPALTSSQDTVQRFYREAQSVAKLNHPNIVAIQNVGRDRNLHFIRMEYVDGVTLESVVRARKKIAWPLAAKIVADTSAALAHAHSKGIIHRDIKPDNIMFNEKSQIVKVMDFGLAKELHSATKVSMTGQIVGTPFFMSPEQAGGKPTDKRSDIYSLGVTFYYMLSGVKPFNGKNLQEIFLKHFFYTPESPKIYTPDLPQSICDVIRKCLKKKKNERYQDASELYKELEEILSSTDTSEVTVTTGTQRKTPSTGFLNLRSSATEQKEAEEAKADAENDEGEKTVVESGRKNQFLNLRGPAEEPPAEPKSIPAPRLSSDVAPEVNYDQTIVANRAGSERIPQHADFDETSFNQTIKANSKDNISLVADSIVYNEDEVGGQTQIRSSSPVAFSYEEAFGEDIDEDYPTLVAKSGDSDSGAEEFEEGAQTVIRDTKTVFEKFGGPNQDIDTINVSQDEDFGSTSVQAAPPLTGAPPESDYNATLVSNSATPLVGAGPDATVVSPIQGGDDSTADEYDQTLVAARPAPENDLDQTVVSQLADGGAQDTYVSEASEGEFDGGSTQVQQAGDSTGAFYPDSQPEFDGGSTQVQQSGAGAGYYYEDDSEPDQTVVSSMQPTYRDDTDESGHTVVSGGVTHNVEPDTMVGASAFEEAGQTRVVDETVVRGPTGYGDEGGQTQVSDGPATVVSHNRAVADDDQTVNRVGASFKRNDPLDGQTVMGAGALPGAVSRDTGEGDDTFVQRAANAFELPSDTMIKGAFVDGGDTVVKGNETQLGGDTVVNGNETQVGGGETVVRNKAMAETGKFDKPDYSEYDEYQGYEGYEEDYGDEVPDYDAGLGDSDQMGTGLPTASDYQSPATGRFRSTNQTIDDVVPMTESQAKSSVSAAARRAEKVGVESVQLKSTSRFFKRGDEDSNSTDTPSIGDSVDTGKSARAKLSEAVDKSPIPIPIIITVIVLIVLAFGIRKGFQIKAEGIIGRLRDSYESANSEKDVFLRKDKLRAVKEEYLKVSVNPPIFYNRVELESIKKAIDSALTKASEQSEKLITNNREKLNSDKKDPKTGTTTPEVEAKPDPELVKATEAGFAEAKKAISAGDLKKASAILIGIHKALVAVEKPLDWHAEQIAKVELPVRITTSPSGMKLFVADKTTSIGRAPKTIFFPIGQTLKVRVEDPKFYTQNKSKKINDFAELSFKLQRKVIAQFQLSPGKVPLPGASGLSATTSPIVETTPIAQVSKRGNVKYLYATTREGLLRCFDLKNDKRWIQPRVVGSFGDHMPRAKLYEDAAIFVSSPGVYDSKNSSFYNVCAVDPQSGTLLWSNRLPAGCTTSPVAVSYEVGGKRKSELAIGLADGTVVFLTPDVGKILNDSAGNEKRVQLRATVTGTPVQVGNHLIVSGSDNRIYSISMVESATIVDTHDLVFDSCTEIVRAGNKVIFGQTNGAVQCLLVDESGKLQPGWINNDLTKRVRGDLLVAENRAFVSDGEKLVAIELSSGKGVQNWKSGAKGVVTSAAYGEEGSIYVANSTGVIYSLDSLTGDLLWSYECQDALGDPHEFEAAPITINSELHGPLLLIVSRKGYVTALPR